MQSNHANPFTEHQLGRSLPQLLPRAPACGDESWNPLGDHSRAGLGAVILSGHFLESLVFLATFRSMQSLPNLSGPKRPGGMHQGIPSGPILCWHSWPRGVRYVLSYC